MQIEHKAERSEFLANLDGHVAHLKYREAGERLLDYHHTFVPPPLRGAGVAGTLVRYALDWAREQGYTVQPSCSFVARFIERHPQYADLTV